MNVILYSYRGERNRVNKLPYCSTVLEVTGKFKADTSVLSPSLLLSLPTGNVSKVTDSNSNVIADVVIEDGGSVLNFNYFYIKEFNRYYFVTSIIVSSNNLLTVSGEVDPLTSFKDEYMNSLALISRNEFDYDPLLVDGLMSYKEKHEIVSRDMSTAGSLVNFAFNVETSGIGTKNFIIGLLQKADSQYVTDYEPIEVTPPVGLNLPRISSRRRSEGLSSTVYYAISYSSLKAIAKEIFDDDTKKTFIISCLALPFEVTSSLGKSSSSYNVVINDYLVPASQGNLQETFYMYGSESQYLIIADETFPDALTYLDIAPYNQVTFYLPFYGNKDISYERIAGKRIIVFYTFNASTGEGSVNIYNVTDNLFIFQTNCTLGLRLSLSTTNELELQNARNANTLNTTLSMVASMISMAGGLATGNPLAVGLGGVSLAHSVAGSMVKEMSMLDMANVATPSTNAGAHSYLKVRITFEKSIPTIDDSSSDFRVYAHQAGLPLQKIRSLSSMDGFTTVSKIHLENCTATEIEKSSILSSLNSGVIL